jgi:hypothetical protein
MEQRCGYRRAVNVSITVRTREGLAGKAVLCDVSASGARLETSLPLSVHSVIYVQFAVRHLMKTPKRETLEAEVVRPTMTGFGVEWTQFAPGTARLLHTPLGNAGSDVPVRMQPVRRRVRH